MTRANLWTDQVTQQFIVVPRTVENPIADMARIHTHSRGPAAIEPWTHVAGASVFVFSPWTVGHPVADDEDGETVAVTWTSEVGLWTLDGLVVCGVHACDCVAASSAEGDYPWWSVDCHVFVDNLQDRHSDREPVYKMAMETSVSPSVRQSINRSVEKPGSKHATVSQYLVSKVTKTPCRETVAENGTDSSKENGQQRKTNKLVTKVVHKAKLTCFCN